MRAFTKLLYPRTMFLRTGDQSKLYPDNKVECSCGVWYDLREFALDCYFQDHPWLKF